jgi:hypothetical protein
MVWSVEGVRVSVVVTTNAAGGVEKAVTSAPAAAVGNCDIVMVPADALSAVITVPEGMLVPLIGIPTAMGGVVVKADAGTDEMVS